MINDLRVVIISFCLIISTAIQSFVPITQYVVTEYKSEEAASFLWECLIEYAPNEYVAAGILGYFKRESELRSDAVAGWPDALAYTNIDHCINFTEQIDAGLKEKITKDKFIEIVRYQYGGYGLGQWCTIETLDLYYDFASEWNTSIADAKMQCAFVINDIELNYPNLWEKLCEVEKAQLAGELIGRWYDGTASYQYIGQLAEEYYQQFS